MGEKEENIQIRLGLAERKNEELAKDNSELQSEIERLNSRIKELEGRPNGLQYSRTQELHKKQTEINDLCVQKSSLEREKANLTSQQADLEAENARLTTELRNTVSRQRVRKVVAIVAFLALVVGLVVAFSTGLTLQKWRQWQHVVGSIGGVFLFGLISCLLGFFLREKMRLIARLIFGVFLVVNGVLTGTLRENYQIVSFWMSGCLIVASAFAAWIAFDDGDSFSGGILVGEGVLSILLSITLTAVLI